MQKEKQFLLSPAGNFSDAFVVSYVYYAIFMPKL